MGTVGTTAVTFEITSAFDFVGKKNDSAKARRTKNLLFSATRTDFNENTGLTGRQSAAAFRSTAQLT